MPTVKVRCASCGNQAEVDEIHLGKKCRCNKCQGVFVISPISHVDPCGTPDHSARDACRWEPGTRVFDEYVVERKLGEGGMGAVYLLAASGAIGQRFAAKKTHLRDEATRRNFLAELRTWIDLPEHPHLVACRFFRTVGDELVIFAEYVEGGALSDWIRQRKLVRLDQVLDVAIQFAWGLHAAHEQGLVHQDVKPGNVLMTPDGVAKVSDFGLSRARAVSELPSMQTGRGQSLLVPVPGS